MSLNIEVGQKALITVDNWFYAPDGRGYRAVFGTVKSVPTCKETGRWHVEIGNAIVAGSQINYAILSDTCHAGRSMDWTADAGSGVREYMRPCAIYFAD